MEYILRHLAEKLGAELKGDPDCKIRGLASLHTATSGDLTFCETNKFKNDSNASAILVTQGLAKKCSGNLLVVPNPKMSFVQLLNVFYPPKEFSSGIHDSCIIGEGSNINETARLEPNVVVGDNVTIGIGSYIGAGSYLGDGAVVGDYTRFYPRVTVYHDCEIGHHCIIHSGVVIGADGFGFLPNDKGEQIKIPQVGGVLICDNVEIGANATIDRGALENTIIGKGVKLDDQCMVAHNVQIGDNTIIAGKAGVAGSTTLGKNCIVGGATSVSDHLTIADQVIFAGSSTVTKSISKPGIYASGTGIMSHRDWKRSVVRFRQLDKIYERLKKIEDEVEFNE